MCNGGDLSLVFTVFHWQSVFCNFGQFAKSWSWSRTILSFWLRVCLCDLRIAHVCAFICISSHLVAFFFATCNTLEMKASCSSSTFTWASTNAGDDGLVAQMCTSCLSLCYDWLVDAKYPLVCQGAFILKSYNPGLQSNKWSIFWRKCLRNKWSPVPAKGTGTL